MTEMSTTAMHSLAYKIIIISFTFIELFICLSSLLFQSGISLTLRVESEALLTFLLSQEASGGVARVKVLLPAAAVAPSLCHDGLDGTPFSLRAPKTPIAFQPTSGTPAGIGNATLSGLSGSVEPRSWISRL